MITLPLSGGQDVQFRPSLSGLKSKRGRDGEREEIMKEGLKEGEGKLIEMQKSGRVDAETPSMFRRI